MPSFPTQSPLGAHVSQSEQQAILARIETEKQFENLANALNEFTHTEIGSQLLPYLRAKCSYDAPLIKTCGTNDPMTVSYLLGTQQAYRDIVSLLSVATNLPNKNPNK